MKVKQLVSILSKFNQEKEIAIATFLNGECTELDTMDWHPDFDTNTADESPLTIEIRDNTL